MSSRALQVSLVVSLVAIGALGGPAHVAALVEPPACDPVPGLLAGADAMALWHFDEGIVPLAFDASPNANHGLVGGAASVASPHACALAFDAADHRVTVQDAASLDVSGPLTISTWVRLRAHEGGVQQLLGKGDGYRLSIGGIAVNGNELEVLRVTYMFQPGATFTTHSSGEVLIGPWTHVAVTIDAGQVRFYVGGALDSAQRSEGAVRAANAAPLLIGAEPGPQVPHMDLDEVALYDRVLNAEEIGALAAA